MQGIDYAYTLQGWLKGINSYELDSAKDMGQDSKPASIFARVSRDVYGFSLGYYNDDYTPIGADANAFALTYQPITPVSSDNSGNQLFNGNISYTTLALSKIRNGTTAGYTYNYDQLNRLTEMNRHNIAAGAATWNNSSIITAYSERIAYDANGNILKYLRHGADTTGMPLDMDSLGYKYNRDGNGRLVNNRLNHVRDTVSSSNYTADIDDQSEDNYTYDYIGNLKEDAAEGLSNIDWTVYGKIKKIDKATGSDIEYGYDAGGNRTTKRVYGAADTLTFYIRDAQGNVLAIYSKTGSSELRWDEQHLYGSSRLGMWRWDTIVPVAPPVLGEADYLYDSLLLGSRAYELANHLGNVLSTISDKKIGNDSSGIVNYYIAEVLSQNDYYPFGMMMPGRKYSGGSGYRYGFNGKEMDNEVKGEGVQYDYGFRIYDVRLGRFLSVDPLFQSYPWYTPYQFAGNMPIWAVDLDGLEELKATKKVKIFAIDATGKTMNEGQSFIDNFGGTSIIRVVGTTVTQQGDLGGLEEITHIDIVMGISRTQWIETTTAPMPPPHPQKLPDPEPDSKNNIVETNEEQIKTGDKKQDEKKDDVYFRTGTETVVEPLINPMDLTLPIDVPFKSNNRLTDGAEFEDQTKASQQLSEFVKDLKGRGITTIDIHITTHYKEHERIPNYPNVDALLTARTNNVKAILQSHGIKVNLVIPHYNVPQSVYASTTSKVNVQMGWKTTDYSIKQKMVNGKPTGKIQRIGQGSPKYQLGGSKPTGQVKWNN